MRHAGVTVLCRNSSIPGILELKDKTNQVWQTMQLMLVPGAKKKHRLEELLCCFILQGKGPCESQKNVNCVVM